MATFYQSEITQICLFYNAPHLPVGSQLPDHYFLESGSVDHPTGDKLEVVQNGYIVSFSDQQHPFYYQRNSLGLQAALERLNNPTN